MIIFYLFFLGGGGVIFLSHVLLWLYANFQDSTMSGSCQKVCCCGGGGVETNNSVEILLKLNNK